MSELVRVDLGVNLADWKKNVFDSSEVSLLQDKLDEAEKYDRIPYEDFNDIEMIQWFLYRQVHLKKEDGKSSRTIKEYERELKQFIEQLLLYSKEINIDIEHIIEGSFFKSLDIRHIRRYHEWLMEKSPYVLKKGAYSRATLAKKTTVIRNFLSFIYTEGYIKTPLHKGLLTINVKKDEFPNRDLGPKDVIQLLDYFREINHPIVFAIIHILTTTGLRNEEFCRLKVKDVQYDSITSSYFLDVMGKGNKRRQIPLKEKTINSIKMFRYARGLEDLTTAGPEKPLFTTNTEKAYSNSYLSQYLTKMIARSDLPLLKERSSTLSPHVFRHAFAIISHLSGKDVYLIMRSLGHEKIETTMIYLEKVFERERHAIHSWDSKVFGEYI